MEQDKDLKYLLSHCRGYQGAQPARAAFILCQDIFLFLAFTILLYHSTKLPYAYTALAATPPAFMIVRLFIIQHDCGHGCFFNNKKLNDVTGRAISIITLAPYYRWRKNHDNHHRTMGNIDTAAIGYINVMTIEDYKKLPPIDRFLYKIYRHPFFLLLFGIPFYNIILQRIPPTDSRRAAFSVILHNLFLAAAILLLCRTVGVDVFFKMYIPLMYITWLIGGWIFFLHHNHNDAYWRKSNDWNRRDALLKGSAYHAFPRWFQWMTGYILLHHIHHICPRIPSYRLQECLDAEPLLQHMNRHTASQSFSLLFNAVYDEKNSSMTTLPLLK